MLACGCNFSPGEPIPQATVKAHYEHTMGAMLMWELMRRPGQKQDLSEESLAFIRIRYIEALERDFPEAKLG